MYDFGTHIKHLRTVSDILSNNGIEINAKKCQVNYLERTISSEGYGIDLENIKTVTDLENTTPSTVEELWKVLGLLGYYRRYIKGYARTAQPLFDLLKKDNMKDSTKVIKSSTPIEWRNCHQKALQELILAITSPPLLGYPDFELPFTLHIDASTKGLGAALYQY